MAIVCCPPADRGSAGRKLARSVAAIQGIDDDLRDTQSPDASESESEASPSGQANDNDSDVSQFSFKSGARPKRQLQPLWRPPPCSRACPAQLPPGQLFPFATAGEAASDVPAGQQN